MTAQTGSNAKEQDHCDQGASSQDVEKGIEVQGDASKKGRRKICYAMGVALICIILPAIGLAVGLSMKRGSKNTSAEKSISQDDSSLVLESGNPASPYDIEKLPGSEPMPLFASMNNTTFPSRAPTQYPTNAPTLSPTSTPREMPTKAPTIQPTRSPTKAPTLAPTDMPTVAPTKEPTKSPTSSPTETPTEIPTTPFPTRSPVQPFLPGDLSIIDKRLDIEISTGLSVRMIAMDGWKVRLADGTRSSSPFHTMMDAAGVIPLTDGKYVYVSNSEVDDRGGGVYAVYFAENGDVIDYKELLTKTDKNCGGGITPWNTWVSCEEVEGGQCWQIDPDPQGENHSRPRETVLGGLDGGKFESVACDNSNPQRPIFFVTEDSSLGALRRYEANGNGWDSLHNYDGIMTYLRIIDDTHFEWTSSKREGRKSAYRHFQNAEGIEYHDGKLYFVSKETKKLFILNLDDNTYESEITGYKFIGRRSLLNEPDQILLGQSEHYMYFCEDGGVSPGVFARDRSGVYHTVFRGIPRGRYEGDETVGIALSPDGKRLYAGFQDAGLMMEFNRDDGLPF